MAAESVQLKFRVPAELRAALEAAAEASGRSLSAEITARLESTVSTGQALTLQEIIDAIYDYDKRIDSLEDRMSAVEETAGVSRRGRYDD